MNNYNFRQINIYTVDKIYIGSYTCKQHVIDHVGISAKMLTKCLNGTIYCYRDYIYKYEYKDDIRYPDIVLSDNPLHHYALHNINGSELCHAVGCRRHKDLIYGFGGLFCSDHYDNLLAIRDKLDYYKNIRDMPNELFYRQQEFSFRKKLDPAHVYRMSFLEKVT